MVVSILVEGTQESRNATRSVRSSIRGFRCVTKPLLQLFRSCRDGLRPPRVVVHHIYRQSAKIVRFRRSAKERHTSTLDHFQMVYSIHRCCVYVVGGHRCVVIVVLLIWGQLSKNVRYRPFYHNARLTNVIRHPIRCLCFDRQRHFGLGSRRRRATITLALL